MFHCINLFVHSHISLDRGQLSKKNVCVILVKQMKTDIEQKKSTESIIVSKNISIVCNKNHRLSSSPRISMHSNFFLCIRLTNIDIVILRNLEMINILMYANYITNKRIQIARHIDRCPNKQQPGMKHIFFYRTKLARTYPDDIGFLAVT